MKVFMMMMLLIFLLPCKGQGLMSEVQQKDSVMCVLEWRYDNKHPWCYLHHSDSIQSVMFRHPQINKINPNATLLKKGINDRIPASAFSRKDDMMWAKDYNWSTFFSDILIGR